MTIGTLVKITAAKKLMMKISEKTYHMISTRLTAECKKKNFPTDRLATFSLKSDDGDDCHFVMISLDKYDKQNMRKFEVLLKKDVAIQYRMKPYDFIPDGEDEQRCGINLELISIRQVKPKSVETTLLQHEHQLLKDAKKMGIRLVLTDSGEITRQDEKEIDEIADKAAARAINPSKELNAEEQAIDEDVEKQVLTRFMRELSPQEKITAKILLSLEERQKDDLLPLAPPVLERQTAMTHRRRRTGTVTPLEQQMKALEDADE